MNAPVSRPLTATAPDQDGLVWYDLRSLGILGQGWPGESESFQRLPARAQKLVRAVVWDLSRHCAGLSVRFATDADRLVARWKPLGQELAMPHMPATGMSGVDLYVQRDGRWRWAGGGHAAAFPSCVDTLISGIERKQREYRLYLPLYNGVTSIELGLPAGASLSRSSPSSEKPICYYGTSIVQGGCASRPGMAYPAILQRRFGREAINLGFSGNGPMDLELAELIAELDVACYVIDCLPNMGPKDVEARAERFVGIIRKSRPSTPIVLIENIIYDNSIHYDVERTDRLNNRALRAAYERMLANGVSGLHYIRGDGLIGDDGEATVDSVHPTDLGFLRMADALEPYIRKAFGG